jgi:spore maturation protein CgeB
MRDTVQLFTAQNGQTSAKALLPDGSVRHIHSLVDPAAEGAYYGDIDFWGSVIVFAGIGLGWHIARRIHGAPAGARLVVIDFYDECLEFCKKNVFTGMRNRIDYLSASTFGSEALGTGSPAHQAAPIQLQVIKHPASFDINRRFYESMLDRLFSSAETAGMRTAKVRRPEPAQKAMVMHGNFFLEEEVKNALQANEIEAQPFTYRRYGSSINYESALMRQIQEDRPSFVISINMKGFGGEEALVDITRRLGVPVVVWFVDDPRRIVRPKPTASRDHVIAACWEKAFIPWLRHAGFGKALHLPLATDPALFSANSQTSPTCRLGFVGTSMVDAYAGNIRDKFLWTDSLTPLVEEVSDRLVEHPDFDVDANLADQARNLGINLPFSDAANLSWLSALAIHTASMKKRKAIVGGLVNEGIETFGDEAGWKRLLGPLVKTHPDIDYRTGLGDVYRGIRINVNVTSCQMPTAVNQRVFDIPCCGSFVLSDDQKDLHELFDVGREAIVYANLEDLKDKIRFYEKHESGRNAVIAAARKRISGEHTYRKRINDLLRFMVPR